LGACYALPMRCPLCRENVTDSRAKPFCSERCRGLDLSKWIGGDYRIIGERVDPTALRDTAELPLHSEELP
jgi:endogenous inhibitor of DNA gyrase (YacG/DUF329 family)